MKSVKLNGFLVRAWRVSGESEEERDSKVGRVSVGCDWAGVGACEVEGWSGTTGEVAAVAKDEDLDGLNLDSELMPLRVD